MPITKEALIDFLETLRPDLDKHEAVGHAIMAARSGGGLSHTKDVSALVVSRLNGYRKISVSLALLSLMPEKKNGKIASGYIEIARFRINQSVDYEAVIERIQAFEKQMSKK